MKVTLEDGSTAYVQPNGSITSAVGGVSFQEPDGNGGWITYDTAPGRQAQHVEAVQAFKESRQYRRAVRRLRPARMTMRRSRPSRAKAAKRPEPVTRATDAAGRSAATPRPSATR